MRPDAWLLTRMLNGTLSVVPRKLVPSTVPAFPVSSHAPEALMLEEEAILSHCLPVLYQNELVLISYTSNPCVGTMRCRASAVIRGMSNPLSGELISSIAWGFAFDPSALMATFWLRPTIAIKNVNTISVHFLRPIR